MHGRACVGVVLMLAASMSPADVFVYEATITAPKDTFRDAAAEARSIAKGMEARGFAPGKTKENEGSLKKQIESEALGWTIKGTVRISGGPHVYVETITPIANLPHGMSAGKATWFVGYGWTASYRPEEDFGRLEAGTKVTSNGTPGDLWMLTRERPSGLRSSGSGMWEMGDPDRLPYWRLEVVEDGSGRPTQIKQFVWNGADFLLKATFRCMSHGKSPVQVERFSGSKPVRIEVYTPKGRDDYAPRVNDVFPMGVTVHDLRRGLGTQQSFVWEGIVPALKDPTMAGGSMSPMPTVSVGFALLLTGVWLWRRSSKSVKGDTPVIEP